MANRKPPMPDWYPTCPLCRGPIERVEFSAKPGSADMLVRWVCHGKQDWMVVPAHQAASGAVIASGFRERAA